MDEPVEMIHWSYFAENQSFRLQLGNLFRGVAAIHTCLPMKVKFGSTIHALQEEIGLINNLRLAIDTIQMMVAEG